MSCYGRIANCVSCLQSLFGNNNPNQAELKNQNEIEMRLKTPLRGGRNPSLFALRGVLATLAPHVIC